MLTVACIMYRQDRMRVVLAQCVQTGMRCLSASRLSSRRGVEGRKQSPARSAQRSIPACLSALKSGARMRVCVHVQYLVQSLVQRHVPACRDGVNAHPGTQNHLTTHGTHAASLASLAGRVASPCRFEQAWLFLHTQRSALLCGAGSKAGCLHASISKARRCPGEVRRDEKVLPCLHEPRVESQGE